MLSMLCITNPLPFTYVAYKKANLHELHILYIYIYMLYVCVYVSANWEYFMSNESFRQEGMIAVHLTISTE